MKEKFKLHFKSDSIGLVSIDEPFGFNTLSFDFMQKPKGMGRDISFNGGEMQLEFGHTRNHYLPELLYYFNYYGFESKVQLIIEIDGVDNIIGDLDFAKSETDGLEYFKCKVIQDSKLQTIKRRSKVKVDMFSNKDLDGEVIEPLVPTNILVKAKATFQESVWEQATIFNGTMSAKGHPNTLIAFINPAQSLIKSEIEDSHTFYAPSGVDSSDFISIKAKDNIKNIKINIIDLLIHLETDVDNGGNGYVDFQLQVRYGIDFETAKKEVLLTSYLQEYQSFDFSGDKYYSIDSLNRGESIWVIFYVKVRQSASYIIAPPKFECFITISGMKINITAESTGYNSITKAFRLVDVMRQVIKSYSGLQIAAPYFDAGGTFYDNFLFDGNLLRSITDKPFDVSLEDLEKSMTEMNADYEVNDRVFFGIEKEYYTNIECGFFDNTQFSTFNKKFNERYSVNVLNYKYKNYQALKENEQPNSGDTIHGETSMLFANKMVENIKDITVEWIRDGFLTDEARKKSIEITTGTSYQNDKNIFALDCIKNEVDLPCTEVSELNHEWNPSLNRLILRSNETLNFNIIGMFVGSNFEIKSPDKNTGIYTIYKVSNQELQLTWTSGGVMTSNNDGVRFTEYTYTIPKEQIPYISRTNEDIVTNEIKSPETFANLRYSVKRNLINYYNSYMATCNLFKKEKEVTNTTYYHNGKATISNAGLTTTENQPILPTNPILSPYIYENMVYSNVDIIDFINLQKELRSKRGYVRSIDKNGNPIKVYPTKMTYKNLEKELTIIAEEKYEPVLMTIETYPNFILINNETRISHLEWNIIDNELSVYDSSMYRFYKPVFWYNVSINGALAKTKNILIEWLELIK